MTVADQIRILCAMLNISQAELARRAGTTAQNMNNKLKRNGYTPDELKQIAESVGCQYVTAFVLPDGQRIEG